MFTLNYRVYLRIEDLPIKKWDEISKKNSLKPLIKRGLPPKDLINVWYDLQDQYTERYGITKEYQEYIDLIKRAVIKKAEFVKTEQRYLLNEIHRMDVDIESKQQQTHPLELHKILPKLSKYYGYPINDSISVVEFFDLLNSMNNG